MTNYYRKSFYRSHNLEVPGSSPGWSTEKFLQVKHLQEFFLFIAILQLE